MPATPHAPRRVRAICRRLMREAFDDYGSALRRKEARKWRETDPLQLELMGIEVV